MQTLAVLMDNINHIKAYKDTTFALMLAAQRRQMQIMIFTQKDWYVRDGKVRAYVQTVRLTDRDEDYYQVLNEEDIDLIHADVILQRKDPPFNLNYIYDSYMLNLLAAQGVMVINPPNALRNINEKFVIAQIPQCTPPTLISKSREDILDFLREHKEIVLKPLDKMGGRGIFKLSLGDKNLHAILDVMNPDEQETLMVQKFLPNISEGDKRILIVNGEAVDHGLVRLPKEGEFRANLAAGGHGIVQALNEREYWLVEQVKPLIKREGLHLVGLDVIGGYITEINVTSPTGLREIENATGQPIADTFWETLAQKMNE